MFWQDHVKLCLAMPALRYLIDSILDDIAQLRPLYAVIANQSVRLDL